MTSLVIADRVKETSTSTGTGDFTVSGAMAGHVTFASKCATNDTLYYCIQAVNASNIPTGEWEVGLGTYSAANTLTRTTVLASSNTGAAVNFSAGGKQVSLVFPAAQAKSVKEKLSAARTYYVRTDGSDSNTGLANTSGAAWLTVQKAIDFCSDNIDANGYLITVSVADGTYTGNVVMKLIQGASSFKVLGTSTGSTIFSPTSGNAFTSNLRNNPTVLVLHTMKISTASASSIRSDNGAEIKTNNINFGASGYMLGAFNGGIISHDASGPTSAYTISGGGFSLMYAGQSSRITVAGSITWTVSTPVTFTTTAQAVELSEIYCYSNTFTGSAVTATRYSASLNAVINTLAGGANYFPGNVAGTTATGGQYA